MRQISIVVLLTIGFLFTLNAHDIEGPYKLKGRLIAKDQAPIAGAWIQVKNSSFSTQSDFDGYFDLNKIQSKDVTLIVEALGYKTQIVNLDLSQSPTDIVIIRFEDLEMNIPEVVILGKSDRLFSKVPGSVHFVNQKKINEINPISGNEVFRTNPGIHVVDEEGVGMRLNLGIRGLDPDRSRNILVLEDGVPVALAPYGEPELYYSPPIDRMSGVEIIKGSGQILYGPQTIGGVVNYITKSPSMTPEGTIRVQLGEGGYRNVMAAHSNTIGNVGYHISAFNKRADQIGHAGFNITDLTGKFLLNINERNSLLIKGSFYDETSNSTYIGLTQTMYDEGGQDFVLMAPDDRLKVRRLSFSAHHELKINSRTTLNNVAFAYTTTRNWRRQDFSMNTSNNNKPANWTGVSWGNEDIRDGAVFMRNSTGNRNRQFQVAGIESRLKHQYATGSINHNFQLGVRYLYEVAFEQRVNGTKFNAESGNIVEDEARPAHAMSLFIQQNSNIFKNFDLQYGLRYENLHQNREIYRRSYSGQIRDTFVTNQNYVNQIIPGAGFTYKLNKRFVIFGGVHAGFAPPRTKDAITAVGGSLDLEAEESINSELGLRSSPINGIDFEITAFSIDFKNQIIPVSESSGGMGSGLINGGRTLHQGLEASVEIKLHTMLGIEKHGITINQNATYINALFNEDRFQNETNIKGNRTPYSPEWILNTSLTYEHVSSAMVRIGYNYIGQQFGNAFNTVLPTNNGRSGLIPAYNTLDVTAGYTIPKINTQISFSVKNLTNERFIVTRRPQGIRLGLPRFIMVSVEYRF